MFWLAWPTPKLRRRTFIIDKGVEADLHTAEGFDALSARLTGAVNGAGVPNVQAAPLASYR